MKLKIRKAERSDAAELLAIYAPYVRETAISFEYEIPTVEEFQKRITEILERYPYLAALKGDEIIGYAYASAFKERAAYDWAVESSIYLKKEYRGFGYGKILYTAFEQELKQRNFLNINACIAYTEEEDEHLTNASVKFHQHMGYRLVGRFQKCGYKFGKWYDMVWMEKLIGEHERIPPKVTLCGGSKKEV